MAKENIDHTFKLNIQKENEWQGVWKDRGHGTRVKLCRGSMTKQFGKPPKGANPLFLRISTKKPKDKEVQWWRIAIRANQPRRRYWGSRRIPMEVKWSPRADTPRPDCELLDDVSAWAVKHLELKAGDVVKLWAGCWVEEE